MKRIWTVLLLVNMFANPLRAKAMDNFRAPQAPRVYSEMIDLDETTSISDSTLELFSIPRKNDNRYKYDGTYSKIRRGEFIAKHAGDFNDDGKFERAFVDVYTPRSIKSGFKGVSTVNVNNIRNHLNVMDLNMKKRGVKSLDLEQSAYYAFAKMMDIHAQDLNLQGDALNSVPVPKYHQTNSLTHLGYKINKSLGSQKEWFKPDSEREKLIRPAIK